MNSKLAFYFSSARNSGNKSRTNYCIRQARHFISHNCLLVIKDFFLINASGESSFAFSFTGNIFHLFLSLESSAEEPRQKETYRGDEFTRDKHAHHHLCQSIVVVFQTMTFTSAPVIKIHSLQLILGLSRNVALRRMTRCVTTLRMATPVGDVLHHMALTMMLSVRLRW